MKTRIKLKASHISKAKELKIYGRIMKSLENQERRLNPGKYMNDQIWIDHYNRHIIWLNGMTWEMFILFSFDHTQDDPIPFPTKKEASIFWRRISLMK